MIITLCCFGGSADVGSCFQSQAPTPDLLDPTCFALLCTICSSCGLKSIHPTAIRYDQKFDSDGWLSSYQRRLCCLSFRAVAAAADAQAAHVQCAKTCVARHFSRANTVVCVQTGVHPCNCLPSSKLSTSKHEESHLRLPPIAAVSLLSSNSCV